MKLLTQQLVIPLLIATVFSSCFSYKSLTRKDPITREFLSKLEPGKKYQFKLKTHRTKVVYIASVGQGMIHGHSERTDAYEKVYNTPFSASFETIERDVSEISVWRYSPGLTVFTCVAGTAVYSLLVHNLIISYYD